MDIISYIMGRSSAKGGGGGSENYSIVTGNFTATGKQMAVSHDWGKIPDMLIVLKDGQNSPTDLGYSMLLYTIGFKQAFIDALGGKLECCVCSGWYNGLMSTLTDNEGIDLEEYTSFYVNYGGVRNVTATSFTVGYDGETSNMGSLVPDKYYRYYAVFGLT